MTSELLDCAAALFAERGYPATTMKDIADAMRLSRAALYRYVESKDDILVKLLAELQVSAARKLGEIRARHDLDPLAQLEEAIRAMTLPVARRPIRFRVLIVNEVHLPAAASPIARRERRAVLDHLVAMISEAIRAGVIRPVDEHVAAFIILGSINWIAWWYSPDGRLTPEQLTDAFVDILMRGLLLDESQRSVSGILRQMNDGVMTLQRLFAAGLNGERPSSFEGLASKGKRLVPEEEAQP